VKNAGLLVFICATTIILHDQQSSLIYKRGTDSFYILW